jgi:hypothetical protein
MNASWEMSGPEALPFISGRIESGCSWEIGRQPTVSGELAWQYPVGDREARMGIDAAPLIPCFMLQIEKKRWSRFGLGLDSWSECAVFSMEKVNGSVWADWWCMC